MPNRTNPKDVGIRMRAVILKLGISMEEAAADLGESRQNLSNILNGYQLPRPGVAYQMEKLLPGVTVQWIFWGDDRLVPAKLARELEIFVTMVKERASSQGRVFLKEVGEAISDSRRPSTKVASGTE